ncbi:MAG: ion transporter [Chlorobi bacterium]|nr:ion transporter [Chlorobiota bacterium]
MKKTLKSRLYEIVFEADTRAGKAFDIILLILILLSAFIVMAESIEDVSVKYHRILRASEWAVTILFTFEYFLRIRLVEKKTSYIFSFYGIIDFLSVIPTYLGFFIFGESAGLSIIRLMRLLRIFRIFKLSPYVSESRILVKAMLASRHKIGVFFFFVIMIVVILGTVMYIVEGKDSGFTSIPQGIYWAVVTLTTVGYGDIAPVTVLGKSIAGFVMILGYAIIAVPTGIVTSEMSGHNKTKSVSTQVCPECLKEGHDSDAEYCKYCGAKINP